VVSDEREGCSWHWKSRDIFEADSIVGCCRALQILSDQLSPDKGVRNVYRERGSLTPSSRLSRGRTVSGGII
jgi:hypothetical protein